MPLSAAIDEIEDVAVVRVSGIMGGMPVVQGTRVPAETIRQYLIAGDSPATIYADYPWLPVGAVDAVIRWCRQSGLACTVS